MQALKVVRSPLTVCVERLQKTAGPAANNENVVELSARLLKNHGTFEACSRIILRDFGLTVRLLRLANSARFKQGGNTVTSVSHAAAMLGTDALRQMIDTVPRHKLSRPVRELVALSHLTAVMARNLISRLEPRYAEEAYICGLFRNIGEVSYALEMPDDYKKVLAGSQGNLAGLRGSCQRHAHFEFDELSTGLLFHWAFQGSLVLAALSTPDALLVQSGHPETDIALAASLAHHICTAYFRGEPGERDNTMRLCWVALATQYQMREAQVESFSRTCLASLEELMPRMGVSAEGLRLTDWLQSGLTNAAVPAAVLDTPLAEETTILELLQYAVAKGVDRAAWLPIIDQTIILGDAAGSGWPGDDAWELVSLIQPRKPPFLLAFGQRQDVWIDFAKDDRFRESPLALKLKPTAFFLLPVCDAKTIRGCLYFDLSKKRDFTPESLLPVLSALRDHLATNMPAV